MEAEDPAPAHPAAAAEQGTEDAAGVVEEAALEAEAGEAAGAEAPEDDQAGDTDAAAPVEAPEVPVAAAPVAAPVAWTIGKDVAPEAELPAPLEERPAHEHQRDGKAKGIAWVC